MPGPSIPDVISLARFVIVTQNKLLAWTSFAHIAWSIKSVVN